MDQRRLLLVTGSFAVAVVLGVIIGLATAPDGSAVPRVTPTATTAAPADVQPSLDPPTWEGGRQPGTPHQMRVREQDRHAFSASLAYALRATAARPLTAADVVIPQGRLFYGAVEGRDASSDEYWAVGVAQVAGVTPAPPNPHVWKRTGASPWTAIAEGPNACDRLPAGLFAVWQGRPALCSGA